jgi:hypothetical protein
MSATKAVTVQPTLPKDSNSDIDVYIASLTDEQRAGIALAEVAYDLAALTDRLRADDHHEADTTELDELRRQAIGHFEPGGIMEQVGALQRYLFELGYALELGLVDLDTGESVGDLPLPQATTD